VLCALLLVAWGAASAGSLIAQIQDWNDIVDAYDSFDALDTQVVVSLWFFILAAASGCWVGMWGLLGLGWRPPLHLGILALVVAVALEITADVVQVDYVGGSWTLGDQLKQYLDRVTFSADGVPADLETRAFFEALPLVTAVGPLLCWVAVLVSGAGKKRPAYSQPYAQPHQQPYYAPPQQPYYAAPPVYQQPPVQQQPRVYQQPPPQPRVAWQDVPPVVPQQRPAAQQPKPPDQRETLPYRDPSGGS
jgi:hypothetical protein